METAMSRHQIRRALREQQVSALEENAVVAGIVWLVAALVTVPVTGGLGGVPQVLGSAGLLALVVFAGSRGLRAYRAGLPASLPTTVGRARVRLRPRRAVSAATAAGALGLPLVGGAAAVALVEWTWPFFAAVLLFGCGATLATWVSQLDDYDYPSRPAEVTSELLRRLCIVADMPVPELQVEPGPVASAWTVRGRIHVTTRTLDLLDDAEVEAVLAHELAHLAHRDAAVMDVCSAPSRVLLGFARSVAPRLWAWVMRWAEVSVAFGAATAGLAALCVPPAFVIGWLSRFSVLGMSRAREFSADAAAATLTGRPSALASALMKLDRQREWAPRSDLRQYDAYAVLCIVGTARRRLGRLFSSHPPTAARIKRLEEIETRVQAAR
jgi:heat shock protein HtpX